MELRNGDLVHHIYIPHTFGRVDHIDDQYVWVRWETHAHLRGKCIWVPTESLIRVSEEEYIMAMLAEL